MRKVVAVLPTLQSRDSVIQALSSLLRHMHLFDRIIISVNGKSRKNIDHVLSLFQLMASERIVVLLTGKLLSAVAHSQFIVNALNGTLCLQTAIFLMADDDILNPSPALATYLGAIRNSKIESVGMGLFMTFNDGPLELMPTEQCFADSDSSLQPLEFLSRSARNSNFSSITSMIIPFAVYRDVIGYMYSFGSAGRRCEYLFASHKTVKSLFVPSEPSAFIRLHDAQEGKVLSRLSLFWDEILYFIWVWDNQPQTLPWMSGASDYGFTLVRFVKLNIRFLLELLRKIFSIT
jgi:hypothetical protein